MFKLCEYPLSVISASELAQAVELDFSRWSPWGSKNSRMFYVPRKHNDKWQVAVWGWEQETENRAIARLEALGLSPTHCLPEDIVTLASIHNEGDCLHSFKTETGYKYLLVDKDKFIIASLQDKNSSVEVVDRLVRSLKGFGQSIRSAIIYGTDNDTELLPGLPGDIPTRHAPFPESFDRRKIAAGLLFKARYNPLLSATAYAAIWKNVLILFLFIFVIHGGQWLVLSKRSTELDSILQSEKTREEANIKGREKLLQYNNRLKTKTDLLREQTAALAFLVRTAEVLPLEISLNQYRFDKSVIELRGKGDKILRFATLLEEYPTIDRVVFVNNITKGRDGKERFRLRIYLKPETGERIVEEEK